MQIWNRIPTMIRTTNIRVLAILGLLLMFVFQACEEVSTKFETEDNLIPMTTYLYDNPDIYSSYISIMEAGNLTDALSTYNPNGEKYTLFLPSNDAFDQFFQESEDYSSLDDLLADTETVFAMSRYHVINLMIFSNDFPLGALPDTALTGDLLTIAYIAGEDSVYYKVNNEAEVVKEDVEMTNGVIHEIDRVLIPITYSGYDWLAANPDYSIMAALMELTALKDSLGAVRINEFGEEGKNSYSLLVEGDSIFNKSDIYSVDDLVDLYADGETNYTDPANNLWQFAAYHIMAEAVFLADLKVDETGRPRPFNYNTFASLPVQITSGFDITINKGVEVFDSIPKGDEEWEYIDYLEIMVAESNIQTKNGPIHLVNRVMELFKPGRTQRTFQFYEDPEIKAIQNSPRIYIFKNKDMEDFTYLKWSGLDELAWVKSGSSFERASNQDYIYVDGDFSITYEIPQVLPGRYGFQIRANSADQKNATIQVFLDGKRIGSNVNLTTGGSGGGNPYRLFNLGIIELSKYEKHVVEVRSLIPGRFTWDFIRFESDITAYLENN